MIGRILSEEQPAILKFPASAVWGRMGQPFDLRAENDNAPPRAGEGWPRLYDPARVERAVEAMRDDGLSDGAGI